MTDAALVGYYFLALSLTSAAWYLVRSARERQQLRDAMRVPGWADRHATTAECVYCGRTMARNRLTTTVTGDLACRYEPTCQHAQGDRASL